MSQRKTPIRLSRSLLTGSVMVLTRYSVQHRGGRPIYKSTENGKHDVSADFDALMLEELFAEDASDIVLILDGVALGETLTDEERAQVRAFRERLRVACERHNARIDEGTA